MNKLCSWQKRSTPRSHRIESAWPCTTSQFILAKIYWNLTIYTRGYTRRKPKTWVRNMGFCWHFWVKRRPKIFVRYQKKGRQHTWVCTHVLHRMLSAPFTSSTLSNPFLAAWPVLCNAGGPLFPPHKPGQETTWSLFPSPACGICGRPA